MKPLITGWRLIDECGELGRYKFGHGGFADAWESADLS
jgi:hypothetical protein